METSFKSLDIFGLSFNFQVTSSTPVYKTKCGAILSLTCIILVSAAIYIFTKDYKDTENPRVTISSEKGNEWPELNIQDENLFGVFVFTTPLGPIPAKDVPKYLTIRMVRQTYSVNPQNPNETIWTSEGRLKYVDCRDASIAETNMKHVSSSGGAYFYKQGFFLCSENNDNWDIWKISGSPNALPWTFVKVDFLPCSLPNEADCAPKDAFSYIRGRFSAISKNYKLSDKENPIQILYESDMIIYGINPHTVETHMKKTKEVFVFNEDKDFAGSKLKAKFHTFSDESLYTSYRSGSSYCSPETVDTASCIPYTSTLFVSGSEKETVLRLYPKLFSSVSELGGFGDLIFILGGLLYSFYVSFHYKKFLKKKIFGDKNFEKNCVKKMKFLNNKLSDKELEKEVNSFYKESLSGIEAAKNSGAVKELINLLVGPQYAKVLPLLSLLKKNLKQKKKDGKEDSIEDPFEFILNDSPEGEIEIAIQRELRKIFSERKFDKEIIVEDILDGGFPKNRNDLDKGFAKKKLKNFVMQDPNSRNFMQKSTILRNSQMRKKKQKRI